MKACRLRTEYLTNPIGIDITSPRLSWNCEGGEKQSAYRIVATTRVRSREEVILWDSGKVMSDKMHLIPWGGAPLKSRDLVEWSVTLWDENDVQGEASETATFELGLLNKEDWEAKWITGDYVPKKSRKKRYPVDCFRKSFTLENQNHSPIFKARAYISACGLYEGTINGKKIGDFCLAPGITDYRKRIQYQAVDITDLVKEGENELAFMLADGWYRGSVGAWGMKNYYGTETKLIAQIEIEYENGETERIVTDDSFQWTNEGPIRFADNKDGEIYDARLEDMSKASWTKAKVTNHPVTPTASNNFALTEHERFKVKEVITTPSGKTVWNFGQNIAGYIEFYVNWDPETETNTITNTNPKQIRLRFGEKLDSAGEFTQANIQCIRGDYVTPLQQITYICPDGANHPSPDGANYPSQESAHHYKTRFAIFGFQYVLVESDATNPINPEDVTAIAVYSDFETTFKFDSSNELLNKFTANTLWSLKNNSADLPTDCPTRERHGWSGDAQIFAGTASYMVNYAPFALKYERDLCDWQRPDGCLPQIAPEGGTDPYMRVMNGASGWADAGIIIPYQIWKKFGDPRAIELFYEPMKNYALYMIKRAKGFNILNSEITKVKGKDKKYLYNNGQHYGEWAEPKEVHAIGFRDFVKSQPEVSTAYFSYTMSLMAEIAEELGRTEDIPLYKEYEEGTKRAYRQLIENPKFSLDTDRQAKLVRPLYFRMLDKKQEEFAKKRLIKALDNYNWRVGTGFLSTPLILYVLGEIDEKYAYKLLENEEKPGWLYMPRIGATTIWEDWDGPTSDNGKGGGIASLNHYSKGAVCQWVFEEMCGVKVTGENSFTIAPHPGGSFTYADFSYESVYGKVSVKWEKKPDGSCSYDIEIPPNTTANVIIPGVPPFSCTHPGSHHISS